MSQEAAENLHDVAAARNVTVSVTGQPAVLPGVRRLIYEIVYNLCDNAIKYNRDGGRVDVTVAADAGGSSITVADTGIGIPEADRPNIFNRFYRVDKARARANGGSGVGLALCAQITEAFGTQLTFASRVGEGTTVTILLQKEAEHEEAAQQQ